MLIILVSRFKDHLREVVGTFPVLSDQISFKATFGAIVSRTLTTASNDQNQLGTLTGLVGLHNHCQCTTKSVYMQT